MDGQHCVCYRSSLEVGAVVERPLKRRHPDVAPIRVRAIVEMDCSKDDGGYPVLCQNSDSHGIPKRRPTALGPVANTDAKLLIYGLFQKSRVLAQDGERGSNQAIRR